MTTKKYVILLAQDVEVWNSAPAAQQESWMDDHRRFDEHVAQHGAILAGEALDGASTATTVRRREGQPVVTDGPFVELVEQLGGFYLVELPSLDQAIEAVQLLPDCYSIEIRPTIEV